MKPTRYQGTGGYEGDEYVTGLSKPITFGICIGVIPIRINRKKNTFQIDAYYKSTSILWVGERLEGSIESIPNDGNKFDLFGEQADEWCLVHQEAMVKAYITDRIRGCFRLSFTPKGTIVCNAEGKNISADIPTIRKMLDILEEGE